MLPNHPKNNTTGTAPESQESTFLDQAREDLVDTLSGNNVSRRGIGRAGVLAFVAALTLAGDQPALADPPYKAEDPAAARYADRMKVGPFTAEEARHMSDAIDVISHTYINPSFWLNAHKIAQEKNIFPPMLLAVRYFDQLRYKVNGNVTTITPRPGTKAPLPKNYKIIVRNGKVVHVNGLNLKPKGWQKWDPAYEKTITEMQAKRDEAVEDLSTGDGEVDYPLTHEDWVVYGSFTAECPKRIMELMNARYQSSIGHLNPATDDPTKNPELATVINRLKTQPKTWEKIKNGEEETIYVLTREGISGVVFLTYGPADHPRANESIIAISTKTAQIVEEHGTIEVDIGGGETATIPGYRLPLKSQDALFKKFVKREKIKVKK